MYAEIIELTPADSAKKQIDSAEIRLLRAAGFPLSPAYMVIEIASGCPWIHRKHTARRVGARCPHHIPKGEERRKRAKEKKWSVLTFDPQCQYIRALFSAARAIPFNGSAARKQLNLSRTQKKIG
jgi:hypothetical protein